eukprot:2267827-Pleurochrysis_carterae.AAC.1
MHVRTPALTIQIGANDTPECGWIEMVIEREAEATVVCVYFMTRRRAHARCISAPSQRAEGMRFQLVADRGRCVGRVGRFAWMAPISACLFFSSLVRCEFSLKSVAFAATCGRRTASLRTL